MRKIIRRHGEGDSQDELKLIIQRRMLANHIKNQRADERDMAYEDSHISRGMDWSHLGVGNGYNAIHGLDFRSEIDRIMSKNGKVNILDIGCGLGYFIRDVLEHGKKQGYNEKLGVRGLTLTRVFKAQDTSSWEAVKLLPVVPHNLVDIGHAQNMPYPDSSQDIVVSTFGPYTYYSGPASGIGQKPALIAEMYRVTAPGGAIYIADRIRFQDVKRETPIIEGFRKKHPDALAEIESSDYLRIKIKKPDL